MLFTLISWMITSLTLSLHNDDNETKKYTQRQSKDEVENDLEVARWLQLIKVILEKNWSEREGDKVVLFKIMVLSYFPAQSQTMISMWWSLLTFSPISPKIFLLLFVISFKENSILWDITCWWHISKIVNKSANPLIK